VDEPREGNVFDAVAVDVACRADLVAKLVTGVLALECGKRRRAETAGPARVKIGFAYGDIQRII